MTLKQLAFLKKHGEDIEIMDQKLIPLVQYLIKGNNFFKTDQDIINETGFSRYLVKNARTIINDFITEKMK